MEGKGGERKRESEKKNLLNKPAQWRLSRAFCTGLQKGTEQCHPVLEVVWTVPLSLYPRLKLKRPRVSIIAALHCKTIAPLSLQSAWRCQLREPALKSMVRCWLADWLTPLQTQLGRCHKGCLLVWQVDSAAPCHALIIGASRSPAESFNWVRRQTTSLRACDKKEEEIKRKGRKWECGGLMQTVFFRRTDKAKAAEVGAWTWRENRMMREPLFPSQQTVNDAPGSMRP